MAKGKTNWCQKWGCGSFVALPRDVLRSHTYANLSPTANKLLSDLLSQYTGNNNGDLCAAMTLMKLRGWSSNCQLTKSRNELLLKGLVAQSRQGGRNNPTLFSVTFYSIDECRNKKTGLSRHEVLATSKPANTWKKFEPAKPVMNLKEAQKAQKKINAEENISSLDRQIKQMQAGIKHWEKRKN